MAIDLLGKAYPPNQGYPTFQGIDPSPFGIDQLPMEQDGSPTGIAPGEEWLDRLKSAGEKFRELQAFLDQAQGPEPQLEDLPGAAADSGMGPGGAGGPQQIPGWGAVLAGLGDLILSREEDYDPFTELPPDPSPSLLDKVTAHNLRAQQYGQSERQRQEGRLDDLSGRRSRERNVLLGSLLPYILKDQGDGKETDYEKIQGRIRLLRESIPGYDELEPDEQRRLLLEMFPGASMPNQPKTLEDIRAEAEARAEGTYAGRPDKATTDKLAAREGALYDFLVRRYVTQGEGGLVPVPMAPDKAHEKAMAVIEQWRKANGRPTGGAIGSTPIGGGGGGGTEGLDTEGHPFVDPVTGDILYPGDEGYDELAGGAGGGGGAAFSASDLGSMDPRLASAYRALQGTAGYPPQPAPPGVSMSGMGDVLTRGAMGAPQMPGVMGGASTTAGPGLAPPGGMPPAPPTNPIKALAGFRIFVQQNPGQEAVARLKFYNKYGIDPYELEQAPGPGR